MAEVAETSCAAKLRVLADETRLAVVRTLMRGPHHVGDLHRALGVDQSLLSHHLKLLREADLVVAERDGKAVLYRLAPAVASASGAVDLGCCLLTFP